MELRLDPLPRQDWPTALAQVCAAITKPLIVTIRTAREGGEVDLAPTEYGEACQALLAQGSADALDIEWLADKTLTEELRDAAHRAGVSALFSEHHFGSTPDTGVMTDTLVDMLDLGADIAKLAVMPRNRADAARLLLATAQAAAQRRAKPYHYEYGPRRRRDPLLRRRVWQRGHFWHAVRRQRPRPAAGDPAERKADFRRRFMKCRAFLPALALLLLTACGKAELTGISLQPVTVQAGETAEAAVQYETAAKPQTPRSKLRWMPTTGPGRPGTRALPP